jgi:aspartyl-tRNA(Asn)/glutamyl-tRNA(Gln) amidotransferase subunit A
MPALHALSAQELLVAYRNGTLSPVEVTHSVLDHIARCEPALHATYALDREGAVGMAQASEARWRVKRHPELIPWRHEELTPW